MNKYNEADKSVYDIFESAMEKYHEELTEVGVKLKIFMLTNYDADGARTGRSTMRKNGIHVVARIRVTNAKERVYDQVDAEVTIDGASWEDMDAGLRLALADHELSHLSVVYDEDGKPQIDLYLRPKLSTVPHDAELGIFYGVMKRHGQNALDSQLVKKLESDVAGLEIE